MIRSLNHCAITNAKQGPLSDLGYGYQHAAIGSIYEQVLGGYEMKHGSLVIASIFDICLGYDIRAVVENKNVIIAVTSNSTMRYIRV